MRPAGVPTLSSVYVLKPVIETGTNRYERSMITISPHQDIYLLFIRIFLPLCSTVCECSGKTFFISFTYDAVDL